MTIILDAYGSSHTHTCPGDPECEACAMRDCPHGEPLHYDGDGCPSCDPPESTDAEPTPGDGDPF